jgi:hypothetical protein
MKVSEEVAELVVRGCMCACMAFALFALAIWGVQ